MDFEKELSEIYPWILKVARKFCCSMQDAEDLAGDTVYKLLVNRDKFDCSKPLQPWCLIIMRIVKCLGGAIEIFIILSSYGIFVKSPPV